jgi:hypothetical protein
VDFIIKEMAEDGGGKPSGSDAVIGNCSVVVDGFNSPISAGNFVDLCQRGFYNRLPLRKTVLGNGKVGRTQHSHSASTHHTTPRATFSSDRGRSFLSSGWGVCMCMCQVSPALDVLVAGTYKAGFVDPITGKQRRVPLEVVRAEQDGPMPFYGQARNTGLFTR